MGRMGLRLWNWIYVINRMYDEHGQYFKECVMFITSLLSFH